VTNEPAENAYNPHTGGRPDRAIDRFLKSSFSGIAPWILMSVLAGPGRFEIAVLAAFGLTLLFVTASALRGFPVHSLEIIGGMYFATLAIVGMVAPDDIIRWLDDWSGVLSSVVLAAFVAATLLARRPFSLSYAKHETPQELWDTPGFLRANVVISAAWGAVFAFSAACGVVGGLVLHDLDNLWTSWIAPLAAMFLVVAFTEIYPQRVKARASDGEHTAPHLAKIFEWVPGFVVVIGIVALIADAVPVVVGVALIVLGIAGGAVLRRLLPPEPDVATTGSPSA
jgi:hypothetical protein